MVVSPLCSLMQAKGTKSTLFFTERQEQSGLRSPQVILLLVVPRRLFCFGSLVVLDVVFRYLSLC